MNRHFYSGLVLHACMTTLTFHLSSIFFIFLFITLTLISPFYIGLAVFTYYKHDILQLNHFEGIIKFMERSIPETVSESISEISLIAKQMADISIKLQNYKVKYYDTRISTSTRQ